MEFEARQNLRHRIREMVEPTVDSLDLALVGVNLTGSESNLVLRLAIDKPGGVTVSDCTDVSRALSPEFDVEDPIDGPWRLEVSSPGMDRPIERDTDFVRFSGYRAKVRMAPDWGRRRYVGELVGLNDSMDAVIIRVGDETFSLPRTHVDRVQLDLTPDEFAALGQSETQTNGDQP